MTNNSDVLKQLGEGGYGTVHLVVHTRYGIAAYKTCPGASTDRKELEVEAEQHRNLRHLNVVILYDTVFNSMCCGLFIEFMKYGSVIEFIKRFTVPPEWRIQIIYETARGMFYLHSNRPIIIHGNLSSQNILIGEGFHAKISGFDLSQTLKENYEKSTTDTQLKGKPIYIAPEYFKDPRRRKSEKFYVYGFAISAWEILSQKTNLSWFRCKGISSDIRETRRETSDLVWKNLTCQHQAPLNNWLRNVGMKKIRKDQALKS